MNGDGLAPSIAIVCGIIILLAMMFAAGYGVRNIDRVKGSACRSGYVHVLVEDKDRTRMWVITEARCEEEKQ